MLVLQFVFVFFFFIIVQLHWSIVDIKLVYLFQKYVTCGDKLSQNEPSLQRNKHPNVHLCRNWDLLKNKTPFNNNCN